MQKPIFGDGLCRCGCGLATATAARTDRASGRIKGQPYAFLHGHSVTKGPVAFWGNLPVHLPNDQCWEWQGTRHEAGYGLFGSKRGGEERFVSRRMWVMTNGRPIPKGFQVLHRCDNPPCCNPEHLFIGTPADNIRDMISKGRGFWQQRPAGRSR